MESEERRFGSPSTGWKGGMDKDSHVTQIANGFYENARNVSIMINGSRFIVKNIKGTVEIPYVFNEGESIVVGAYDDKARRIAYTLVWNSLGNHEVLSVNYDVSELNATKITEGVGLGFKFNNLITGIELVLGRFLYWVDDLNECVALDLENVPATITAANRYLIEAAKAQDPTPLVVRVGTDTTRETNTLTKKVYKFRSRYLLKGGYRTVPSTIAKVPLYQYDYMQFTGSEKVYYDNVIYVSIPSVPYENVEEVELLVQAGNSDEAMGGWFSFKKIPVESIPQSITFTGKEALIAIDAEEANQACTFVPPTAKDVALLPSNVIAWANITDNLDASNVEPKVNFAIDNYTRPTATVATDTILNYFNGNFPIAKTVESKNFDIKIESGTYDPITFQEVQAGDVVSIVMSLQYFGTGDFAAPKTKDITFKFLVDENDMYTLKGGGLEQAALNRRLFEYLSTVDTRYEGYGGVVFYWDTALYPDEPEFIYIVQGENVLNSQFGVTTTVTGLTSSVTQGYPNSSFPATVYTTRKSFKTNAKHSFAVQYEDAKGRRTSAIPMGDIFIPTTGTYDEYPVLSTYIGHLAPTNAERYHVLYGGNKNYDEFLQLWTNAYGERSYLDVTVNQETERIYIDEATSTSAANVAALIANRLNTNPSISFAVTATVVGGEVILTGTENKIKFYLNVESQENNSTTADFATTQTAEIGQPQISEITNIVATNLVSDPITGKEAWTFDVYKQIQLFLEKYPDSGMEYNFVKGDRVRLIAYYDLSPTYFTTIVDTPIISDDAYNVYISENLTTDYSFTSGQNVLVEFYRPKKNLQDVFYHEIGVSGSVSPEGYHLAPKFSIDTDQTSSTPAIINLIDSGDVYYRFRATAFSAPTVTEFIEDKNISDFLPSACTDRGRIAVVDKLALKGVRRSTAIVHSQPIVNNTDINGLAVVLGSSIQEYDVKYGSIQKIFLRMDRELVILFEEKIGRIGILSELVRQQNGNLSYATDITLNRLSTFNYEGGIGLVPESFVRFGDTAYFASPQNNAICRLQPQTEVIEISKYGMASWFQESMDVKRNYLGDAKFIGGYDERNGCYIISLFGYIKADSITGDSVFPLVTFNKNRVFKEEFGLTEKVDMLILNDGTNHYVKTTPLVNRINDNQVQVSYGAGVPIGDIFQEGWLRYRIDTAWFNEEANSWMSFLDIEPDYMTTCGLDSLLFKQGSIGLTNANESRSNFFGEQKEAEITIPFNKVAGMKKLLTTITQISDVVWYANVDGDVSTITGQKSKLLESYFEEYEPEVWSAGFRKDTTTPNEEVPLLDGRDLRDRVFSITLRTNTAADAKLESVTINFYLSPVN